MFSGGVAVSHLLPAAFRASCFQLSFDRVAFPCWSGVGEICSGESVTFGIGHGCDWARAGRHRDSSRRIAMTSSPVFFAVVLAFVVSDLLGGTGEEASQMEKE